MKVRAIDSHTGGEPTRVIVSGGPELGLGSMFERREVFRRQFDHFRAAAVNEPRGSDAVVGALLCEPCDRSHAAGVIFFNNVGYLHMCGHGSIGLVTTLAYMGRMQPGRHQIETPVGTIDAELHADGRATIGNVPSYRFAKDVTVQVESFGPVTGDVAWGGNWFFLSHGSPVPIDLDHIDELTGYTWRIRQALVREGGLWRGCDRGTDRHADGEHRGRQDRARTRRGQTQGARRRRHRGSGRRRRVCLGGVLGWVSHCRCGGSRPHETQSCGPESPPARQRSKCSSPGLGAFVRNGSAQSTLSGSNLSGL